MKIHFVIHEEFESPGAILEWASSRGHQTSSTALHRGDVLPERVSDFDLLILMGGPQCPSTSLSECPHFDASKEMSLIRAAIEQGKAVLGICLGAQLIGQALGAPFEHSPEREIGVFDVRLTAAAQCDPILHDFPEVFPVGHWHGDMPGIPEGAEILVESNGCPRQIIRFGKNVYGLQCHFEFTQGSIEEMIENSAAELTRFAASPYVEQPEQLRTHDYAAINQLLFRFLDKLCAESSLS